MKKRNLMFAFTLITIEIIIGFILTADLDIQQVNYAQETNISPNAKDFLGKFSGYLSEVKVGVYKLLRRRGLLSAVKHSAEANA